MRTEYKTKRIWDTIRQDYENGECLHVLHKRYNIDIATLKETFALQKDSDKSLYDLIIMDKWLPIIAKYRTCPVVLEYQSSISREL